MKNDITELAQREKFEAWAEECCALPWGYLKNRRTNTGYFSKHDYTNLWAAWKAAGAELVEALEKAQAKVVEQGRNACELFDEVTTLRQRIAELESRTVTVKPMRPGHITVGGEKIGIYMRDEVDEFMAALTDAGIKWEAE